MNEFHNVLKELDINIQYDSFLLKVFYFISKWMRWVIQSGTTLQTLQQYDNSSNGMSNHIRFSLHKFNRTMSEPRT